jgi:hypothetical protein
MWLTDDERPQRLNSIIKKTMLAALISFLLLKMSKDARSMSLQFVIDAIW